jgi:hypothetical protein
MLRHGGKKNIKKYGKVELETWSLNQCLPEGTTYKLNIILPALIPRIS